MQIEDRLRQAVARVLNVDAAEIGDDAGLQSHPGWDSMAHVSIMLEIEKEFGMEVDEQLMNCRSIEELKQFLAERV